MQRCFRTSVVFAALLVVTACTNAGGDGLQQLRNEQAASIAPPPPGSGINVAGSSPQPRPPAQTALQPAPLQPAPLAAATSAQARVQFAAVVGAASGSLPSLEARLVARAAQRGITVAATGDAATTHVVRGYFSAFTEQNQTTVIYVWDVLDPAGNRVHRIQGQQKVAGAHGWNSVAPQVMEAIADRTVDDLATWLASRTG